MSIVIEIAKVCATGNFGTFEGDILSGIGSGSVPVDRQAGNQAG